MLLDTPTNSKVENKTDLNLKTNLDSRKPVLRARIFTALYYIVFYIAANKDITVILIEIILIRTRYKTFRPNKETHRQFALHGIRCTRLSILFVGILRHGAMNPTLFRRASTSFRSHIFWKTKQ